MEYVMYTIFVVLAVIVIVWALRRLKWRKEGSSEPINLIVFMSTPVELDSQAITEHFARQWGNKVAFRENHAWGDPRGGVRAYILTDGAVHVLVSASSAPAPGGVTKASAATPHLNDLQKYVLVNHKAHLSIRCLTVSRNAGDSARFSAKALLTFLNMPQVVGYSADSARVYHPKESLGETLHAASLRPNVLFELLSGVHVVAKRGKVWAHTHGMEQFGAPDLSIRSSEQGSTAYLEALLTSAAQYAIDRGPVLKSGDTAELAGDGIVYEIRTAARTRGHDYGRYGALEIVKRVE
jgi:hypothetical protein